MTFPVDDYTPFGYLANPFHRARSWNEIDGGLLRSTDDLLGFGWVEPTANQPTIEASLVLGARWNGRSYQTRADFERIGYRSRHHSAALLSYDWSLGGVECSLTFALAARDRLVAELRLENQAPFARDLEFLLAARLAVRGETPRGDFDHATGWNLVARGGTVRFRFAITDPAAEPVFGPTLARDWPDLRAEGTVLVGSRRRLQLASGETWAAGLALTRGEVPADAARLAANGAGRIIAERRDADNRFYAAVPLPTGDWPDAWKRGWIYDLESTRAGQYPPGGIFRDVWPSWMLSWPRLVLAEGVLDATRFSYAAPTEALRLATTIFRDAPAANVPCVFQGGEPNMVAKDGAVCGTSPAWCLPYHNLWLLYLRTLDQSWLAEIFPRLEQYLDYWLRERTDAAGWIVYRCTWEAGEDCTPRLDPTESGDEIISGFVRPVELQAAVADSAAILARFAESLGLPLAVDRWRHVARDYANRTQQLWDDQAGRFRDWDKRRDTFVESAGTSSYWQTDAVRYSALSLLPLVGDLVTPLQRDRLREEWKSYVSPPWCLWPSWSYIVAEAATTSGWHDLGGAFAYDIVDRVYRANDRRNLGASARPTPGASPEFWPLDLAEFNGSDGYGWGATTTSLWVRQIFGFLEDEETGRVAFRLAPSLPESLLRPGRRFGFVGLNYRGTRLDVTYEVIDAGIEVLIRTEGRLAVQASDLAGVGRPVQFDPGTGLSRARITLGESTRIVLATPGAATR